MANGIWRSAAVLGCAMALSACRMDIDPASQATARTAFDHLRHGEDRALMAMTEPAQRAAFTPAVATEMRRLLPPGEPTPPREVGYNVNFNNGQKSITLRQVYDFGARAVTVTTVLVPGAGSPASAGRDRTWLVRGMNISVSLSDGRPAASGARI